MTEPLSLEAMKTLIGALRDGTATAQQTSQLEQLLRDSPAARDIYVQHVLLCCDLQTILNREALPSLAAVDLPQPRRDVTAPTRRSRARIVRTWAWRVGAAASVAIALLVGTRLTPPSPRTSSGEKASTVATLVAVMDARWGDNQTLPVGARLPDGPLQLTQGLAAIQFDSGAAVILQGPTQCVLESPSHLALSKGRMSAAVPVEAIGFTVRTAQATVVDLGTEFGVSSEGNGATDVHVFRGQVALAPSPGHKNSRQLLAEGIAKRVEADGAQIEDLRPDELAFVRQQEFEARIKALKHSPYHRWLAYSYQLRREPALVLYYTFDNSVESQDRVTNRAGATAGKLDGVLGNGQETQTRPTWVAVGRWPEQRALHLDATQRQQLLVPHCNELNITQAMTVAAWVRPSAALLGPSAVLLSKGTSAGDGRPNYELGLTRQPDPRGKGLCSAYFCSGSRRIASPGFPVVPGQWMHIAATATNGRTVIYVNGHEVARADVAELLPNEGDLLVAASARDLQSSDLGGDGFFEGLLSELALVRRVMSDKEILAMFTAGMPTN